MFPELIAPPLEEEAAQRAKIQRGDQKAEAKTHYESELAGRNAVPAGLLPYLTVIQLTKIASKRNIALKKSWSKPEILNALDPQSEDEDQMEIDGSEEPDSD